MSVSRAQWTFGMGGWDEMGRDGYVTLLDRLARRGLGGRFCAASAATRRARTWLRLRDCGSRE